MPFDFDFATVLDLPSTPLHQGGSIIKTVSGPTLLLPVDQEVFERMKTCALGATAQVNAAVIDDVIVPMVGLMVGDAGIACLAEAGEPMLQKLLRASLTRGELLAALTHGHRYRLVGVKVTSDVKDLHDHVTRATPLSPQAYVEAMQGAVIAVGVLFGTLPPQEQPRRIALRSLVSEDRLGEFVVAQGDGKKVMH